jgi:hypothetical protein
MARRSGTVDAYDGRQGRVLLEEIVASNDKNDCQQQEPPARNAKTVNRPYAAAV